ncbi:MAG: hypothetical protein GWP47_01410 [Actinobacteria bacterium]|nr:hypothetical protein [Actinomycetota bacterium]NCG39094.1 hypothetical protein [Actinomycetota bacterium]
MDESDKFEAPGDAIISPARVAAPTPVSAPTRGIEPDMAGGVATRPGAAILESAGRELRRASSAAAAAGTGVSTTEADIGFGVSGQLGAGLNSHAVTNSVEEAARALGFFRLGDTPIRGSGVN